MVKKVYLIFKTHLDIGFTDLGQNVVNTYLTRFIPEAIKRGYELKGTDTPYIWTTGSWLINEALKKDDGTMDKAIKDGIISWHALPFTSFCETYSKELFEYALSLSESLDKAYGKKTIAAKMSDVPGHTKAIVPFLKKHGVEFLHLGINVAWPLPKTPPVFRWKNGEDEITVMYQDGYGADMVFEDFAVSFGFTNDNMGPQSAAAIKKIYADLKERYPDAEIKASTLNDIALAIRDIKDTLPVIENEIGDPWVQNAGTDPKKVSLYMELLRHIEKNGISGDISNTLLCVPEHTWGCDQKTWFPNYSDWYVEDFARTEGSQQRAYFESSWEEQREYVYKAQEILGTSYEYKVEKPDLTGFTETEIPEQSFELSWQLFDNDDYLRFMAKCLTPGNSDPIRAKLWATLDNIKFGLPPYKGGIYKALPQKAYKKDEKLIIELAFEKSIAEKHGLPSPWLIIEGNNVEVRWFGAKVNRLPQAYWFKVKGKEESWQVRKIGQWIDPSDSLLNPELMATDYGVKNSTFEIQTLDTMLVAPYGRVMLDKKATDKQDMYFNLYNNIWGCNQPMWYSDDSRFRFKIKAE